MLLLCMYIAIPGAHGPPYHLNRLSLLRWPEYWTQTCFKTFGELHNTPKSSAKIHLFYIISDPQKSTLSTMQLLIKMPVKHEGVWKGFKMYIFSFEGDGFELYLLHGSWEINLLPFGTTSIFISISGIKGSHWAKVQWLWDWNGSCQQIVLGTQRPQEPRQQPLLTQIRPTSGPLGFHTGQMWAWSGPALCWYLGLHLGVLGYC